MAQKPVFSKVFEGDISNLVWKETWRQKPWELFGCRSWEELSEERKKRIPADLGDAFNYVLEMEGIKIHFSNQYQPYAVIAAHPYLGFNFGQGQRSLAAQLDAPLFDDEERKAVFEIGRYGDSGNYYVHLKLNNLGIWRSGREELGPDGRAAVQDMFNQKEKITSIPGLVEPDKKLLETTLKIIGAEHSSKKIYIIN